MEAVKQLLRASCLFSLYGIVVGQSLTDSYFFPNNTFAPDNTVSTKCAGALTAPLNCSTSLLNIVSADVYQPLGTAANYSSFCTASCEAAIPAYIKNVTTQCSSDPQPFQGLPATWQGYAIWAALNVTCLQNTATGQYCQDYYTTLPVGASGDLSISDFTTAQLCNPCVYLLFQQIQRTSYSNYQTSLASDWAQIQSVCKVTFPTAVQPPTTNRTNLPGVVPPGSSVKIPCLSGKTYTVVGGDNAQAIAQAHSVATGTLITINNLLPDGSDLQIGQSLCLPQTCTTQIVQSGDTCASIASSLTIAWQLLLSWNPTINQYCTNLIAGRSICVSQPGTAWNGTTIAGASVTKTAVYAATTIAAPGATASGSTTHCGNWYQVQTGDYCQLVALNKTIDLGLFEMINPSINTDCTNLVPGLYYCVEPTQDWNATATTTSGPATTLPAPTTTPSGTTKTCYEWYTIQSGNTCSLIESSFGISFAQLQAWNPSLDSACDNLFLGEAYCVSGPAVSSITISSSSTTTSYATPGAPTPSGTTAQCFTYHTVVSGDTCSALETTFGITMAQIVYWNPSLNSGCTNLLLGEAYCVKGAVQPPSKRDAVTTGLTW